MSEPLSAWESFYVIVGSSAAALTGLQFVVIALIAESGRQTTNREISAFGTPTIVHFCAVLLAAAILSSPWPVLSGAALAIAVLGLVGVGYIGIVIRRTHRQRGYQPEASDWVWHAILPLLAYMVLVGAAASLSNQTGPALFAIAAASLLLLFIGIHNSWDTVTYIAVGTVQSRARKREREAPPAKRSAGRDGG